MTTAQKPASVELEDSETRRRASIRQWVEKNIGGRVVGVQRWRRWRPVWRVKEALADTLVQNFVALLAVDLQELETRASEIDSACWAFSGQCIIRRHCSRLRSYT
jgi:hypothetical protein